MQVHVAQAEITNMPVDAILNPANSWGTMDTGISGTIRRHGGDSIQAEATAASPIAIGAALVTTGGDLPAKFVIHAPIMTEPGMKFSTEDVRRAARAALIAAAVNEYTVLAIPGIGADLPQAARDDNARAIVEELRAHKKPFPETVYLVDGSPEMVQAFEEALIAAPQPKAS